MTALPKVKVRCDYSSTSSRYCSRLRFAAARDIPSQSHVPTLLQDKVRRSQFPSLKLDTDREGRSVALYRCLQFSDEVGDTLEEFSCRYSLKALSLSRLCRRKPVSFRWKKLETSRTIKWIRVVVGRACFWVVVLDRELCEKRVRNSVMLPDTNEEDCTQDVAPCGMPTVYYRLMVRRLPVESKNKLPSRSRVLSPSMLKRVGTTSLLDTTPS